jgi:SAM-dependent methyltransferase
MLTQNHARTWIDRWDRQQEGYVPDREGRFTAIIDAVVAVADRPDPLILDLGCGPGSLSVRLLDRLPGATVIAIDADPLLLELGRTAHADLPGLRFATADLREPGWAGGLGLDRPAAAAVSSTALHWITRAVLPTVYGEVASVLRPGGLMLNADHMRVADGTLRNLERAVYERQRERVRGVGLPEDWESWWEAVGDDPTLADLWRAPVSDHNGEESDTLAAHVEGMRAAGFQEIGTLWQFGGDRVLCGVRP